MSFVGHKQRRMTAIRIDRNICGGVARVGAALEIANARCCAPFFLLLIGAFTKMWFLV